MNKALPDALVTGYEHLIESLELPDRDDRHVLAAAIQSGANVIVTLNLSDFPSHVLAQFSLGLQHPDHFVLSLLRARVKSETRRHAKHLASRQDRERPTGSASDFETLCAGQPDVEQRIYASEIFARLSPFAQGIVNRRWLGYSWREIGQDLEMDYSEVRKAYFRELDSLLRNLSQPGESPKCD